ncbi:hypothetical protein [Ferruginibacter sp. SUN106]|uniref:hypothetical protein n=1 Tax=Ferruginibacter sp. SUN106 TaxID=2978348 RepID=UPI003D3698B3
MFYLPLVILVACSNPANKRAISIDELDSIQAQDKSTLEQLAPTKDMLSAAELVKLADCIDLPCVQLFMKNHTTDFVQAYKGEFNASMHISVKDTSGNELTIPAATLYMYADPQATWRIAHTVHTKQMCDSLLDEFKALGFQSVDKDHLVTFDSKDRYISKRYPGIDMYFTPSLRPWYFKGIYQVKIPWLCYVFEIYKTGTN